MDIIYESLYEKFKGNRFDSRQSYDTYKEEILHIFKKRLSGEIIKWPQSFFHGVDGEMNSYIILTYIIWEVIGIEDFNNIYKFWNQKFFVEYKLDILRLYYGSIEEVFTSVFYDKTFNFDEYIRCNPKSWSLKSKRNQDVEIKKEHYKKKLLEYIERDNIALESIPNKVNIRYLKNLDNGLKYFNNSVFEYVDYVYPGKFNKNDFEVVRKSYDDYYQTIDLILMENNIDIYSLTTALCTKYNCWIDAGNHGIISGIEDVKVNYCKMYNKPYYNILKDKFLGKLQELYQPKKFVEISLSINKSNRYLQTIIKNKGNLGFHEVEGICKQLNLNIEDYIKRIV